MKSVLVSIKPKYCELIASGQKTVEIRKNRPKIDVPFKVYMYCTKNSNLKINNLQLMKAGYGNGRVIGEFMCDLVTPINHHDIITGCSERGEFELQDATGLNIDELLYCLDYRSIIWGWHISNLVIYGKPKDLDEFEKPCSHDCKNCKYWYSGSPIDYEPPCCEWEDCVITRPPQSWCYVEELEDLK